MRLVPIDFSQLARLEITAPEITLSNDEILADLLYPATPGEAERRS